jgi:hypothetical protein
VGEQSSPLQKATESLLTPPEKARIHPAIFASTLLEIFDFPAFPN